MNPIYPEMFVAFKSFCLYYLTSKITDMCFTVFTYKILRINIIITCMESRHFTNNLHFQVPFFNIVLWFSFQANQPSIVNWRDLVNYIQRDIDKIRFRTSQFKHHTSTPHLMLNTSKYGTWVWSFLLKNGYLGQHWSLKEKVGGNGTIEKISL